MTDTEVTRIRIEDYEVGIIGLKSAIETILSSSSNKDDTTVSDELLGCLARQNYIPASARQKYAEAFLREFKKMRGDTLDEIETDSLQIKILGPGCYQCDTLEKTVIKVLNEMKCPASVEHITDVKEICRMGVVSTPALMVDGKVVSKGASLPEKKIKDLINKFAKRE